MKRNLRGWIKETPVWGLELTVAWVVISADYSSNTHVMPLAALLTFFFETERVNSVGRTKELSFGWITLDILPSGVRPSAWHELKILFWVAVGFLSLLFWDIIRRHWTWLDWFTSIANVFTSSKIFGITISLSLILHYLSKQTSNILHYNLLSQLTYLYSK